MTSSSSRFTINKPKKIIIVIPKSKRREELYLLFEKRNEIYVMDKDLCLINFEMVRSCLANRLRYQDLCHFNHVKNVGFFFLANNLQVICESNLDVYDADEVDIQQLKINPALFPTVVKTIPSMKMQTIVRGQIPQLEDPHYPNTITDLYKYFSVKSKEDTIAKAEQEIANYLDELNRSCSPTVDMTNIIGVKLKLPGHQTKYTGYELTFYKQDEYFVSDNPKDLTYYQGGYVTRILNVNTFPNTFYFKSYVRDGIIFFHQKYLKKIADKFSKNCQYIFAAPKVENTTHDPFFSLLPTHEDAVNTQEFFPSIPFVNQEEDQEDISLADLENIFSPLTPQTQTMFDLLINNMNASNDDHPLSPQCSNLFEEEHVAKKLRKV